LPTARPDVKAGCILLDRALTDGARPARARSGGTGVGARML
jgi:hypothetical protein